MTEPHGRPDQQPPPERPDAWVPPAPSAAPQQPPSPAAAPVREPPAPKRSPWSPWWRTALIAILLLLLVLASQALGDALRKPHQREDEGPALPTFAPTASGTPWTPLPTVTPTATAALQGGTGAMVWEATAGFLRLDLWTPTLSSGYDGSVEAGFVVDAAGTLVVLTADANGYDAMAIHGLDPATGQQLWRLDRDQPLCARQLLRALLVCASATKRDVWTQLGTEWVVETIEPSTGRVTASAPFSGWLTLIAVAREHVVFLEQRQPAPHAVVSGLDVSLRPAWTFDLAGDPHHDEMFTENRLIVRKFPPTEGLALDRPRIRTVADGLTALWIGNLTVFLDAAQGRLVGMPRCPRLVDDGERLWCNSGGMAAAYTYDLQLLHFTDPGVHLAFPRHDPAEGDVTVPVFINSDGAAVKVDLATGATGDVIMPTEYTEVFGLVAEPISLQAGGIVFFVLDDYTVAYDPRTEQFLWDVPIDSLDTVMAWRGQFVLYDFKVRVVDAASGHVWYEAREQSASTYIDLDLIDDALITSGLDAVGRMTGP